jgi:hypothetical protein
MIDKKSYFSAAYTAVDHGIKIYPCRNNARSGDKSYPGDKRI